ncbi:uncharacterized protein MKK02DRAFT_4463, partial [Dioszegia hungarica]
MNKSKLVLALVYAVSQVSAHIALWDEAMYGFDPKDVNQYQPVEPLADLPFSSWWFHGYINRPPAPGKMMNLPSGGTYHGQVACNKALTTLGGTPEQRNGIYACEGDDPNIGGIGAMHTDDKWNTPVSQLKDVKGCGLSIAYKSDPFALQPEDFTVISTNYTCPWFKHVEFQIPADLPPCPPGGCHCMWGWVHSTLAGSEQNYVLNYRCNVTGATGMRELPPPKTANKCHLPQDTTNCTVGAKQPHYWLQLERNNNHQAYMDPPFYNGDYGYLNGAQTDLWAGLGPQGSAGRTSPTDSTSPPARKASSTSSSVASSSSVAGAS